MATKKSADILQATCISGQQWQAYNGQSPRQQHAHKWPSWRPLPGLPGSDEVNQRSARESLDSTVVVFCRARCQLCQSISNRRVTISKINNHNKRKEKAKKQETAPWVFQLWSSAVPVRCSACSALKDETVSTETVLTAPIQCRDIAMISAHTTTIMISGI